MSNAEEGIARAQLSGKDGVAGHQKKSQKNLDDRLVAALFSLAFVGLMIVWATAKSPYLTYGSLVVGFLGVILFGVLRVRRIERIREERKIQAREFEAGSDG